LSDQRLVSGFILKNFEEGIASGSMQATAVLADMTGFTRLTDEAMRRGEVGAEWISGVLSRAFTPFIDFVCEQGGFIAEFEGDAALAVFPGSRLEMLEMSKQVLKDISRVAEEDISFSTAVSTGEISWCVGGVKGNLYQLFYGNCVSNVFGRDNRLLEDAEWKLPAGNGAGFFPDVLAGRDFSGEFRTVFPVFLSLEVSSTGEAQLFFDSVCGLAVEINGFLNGTHLRGSEATALVVFGAPGAMESDARRCGEFVSRMRSQFSSVQGGVSAGTAYAGFVGSKSRCSYTVLGSTVNLASRLCHSAEAGEILASGEFSKLIGSHFGVEEGRTLQLKGFGEPQQSFRLLQQAADTKCNTETGVFIGRGKQKRRLAEIYNALDKLEIVNITGEPGIGKSRFLNEFVTSGNSDAFVMVIEGDELMSSRSLRPWQEVFRKLPADIIRSLVLNPDNSELRGELEWAEEHLNTLQDDLLSSSHENTVYSISVFLNSMARSGKFIICIENPGQLDLESLEILQSFVLANEYSKGLIVTTSRLMNTVPEFLTGGSSVELLPFSIEETEKKLSVDTGFTVRNSVAEMLHEKSGGNPLYLEELSRIIQQDQMKGTWSKWQDTRHLLPISLGSLLESRIDHLPGNMREAVAVASVLGSKFDPEILKQILSTDSSCVEEGLSLGIWKLSSRGKVAFRHHLLMETSYKMLLTSRRRHIHRLAADVFLKLHPEPAGEYLIRLAIHAAKADYKEVVQEYLEPAADFCRSTHQNLVAIELYTELERLTEESDVKMRARGKKGAVLEVIGRWEEAVDIYRISINLADSNSDMLQHSGRMRVSLGKIYMQRGYYSRAIKVLEEAEKILSGFHETILAPVYANLGATWMHRGDYSKAGRYLREWKDIAQRSGDMKSVVMAVGTIGALVERMGEKQKVIENCHLQAKLAQQTGQDYLLGIAYYNLGNNALAEGDYEQAESYFRKDLNICRKLGYRQGESVAMGALSTILCYRGMYKKAYEYAAFFVTVSRILGNRYRELSALVDLMIVQMYTDELEEAGKTLEQRVSIAGKMNMKDAVAENYFFQAILELLKENFESALLFVQKAITFSRENNISLEPQYHCVAGVLHTLSGDITTGKDYLERLESQLKLKIPSDTELLDGFVLALKEISFSSFVDLVLKAINRYHSA